MSATTPSLRSSLLRTYYGTAQLGWFRPKALHWAKVVSEAGLWKWIRPDEGIRRRLMRSPPVHVYQTVLGFKTNGPPRGRASSGYLLGGPLLFETDLLDKYEPLSLWKIVDSLHMIDELTEFMSDYGSYHRQQVIYSGFRGVHIFFSQLKQQEGLVLLNPDGIQSTGLRSLTKEKKQVARAAGHWCEGWDWKVTADLWRVVRVPWSIHGLSALRAIELKIGGNDACIEKQLRETSPFTFLSSLRIRMKRHVPLFTFVDGETYGPYCKGWATKLPIAIALHLMWLGYARPRESGPKQTTNWFDKGWQAFFSAARTREHVFQKPTGS